MINEQYSFNKATLSIEKLENKSSKRLKKILFFSILFIAIQFAALVFTYPIFKSENSRILKRENQKLLNEYLILQSKLELAETTLEDLEKLDDSLYRSIFSLSPLPASMRQAGRGGHSPYSTLENYENSDLMISTSSRLDDLLSKAKVQTESYKILFKEQINFEKKNRSIPALRPVSQEDSHLSSVYGIRLHPILGRYKMHHGIDLAAPIGTDVYSPGDGKVIKIERKSGYGNEIIIEHEFGYTTRYGHLSKILVQKGQKITRGQIIAKVGNTGLSTAPHLHYEVKKYGQSINPENYFYADVDPKKYVQWLKQ
ncbi:MAG: M23 family metallopeptidase [Bacteroidales bacterium]|nr:M23 family metallopeptidase [Bacteroidales bacterium]